MSELNHKKRLLTYAFIDSQNLNLGVRSSVYYKGKSIYVGWELDFEKFRLYLKDKFRVDKAFLFIGYVAGNEKLYEVLQDYGYIVVHKPTLEYRKGNRTRTKGNVDAELVLYASAKKIKEFDSAVIVSGDGDFYCLYEYLLEKGKLGKILIPNKHKYSSLLRKFSDYFDFVSTNSGKLKYINKKASMISQDALAR